MAKIDARALSIAATVLLVVLFIIVPIVLRMKAKTSMYTPPVFTQLGSQVRVDPQSTGRVDSTTAPMMQDTGAALMNGNGLSTSMLPKEIPSQEDFGNFSPEVIMAGQNYLDPRSQIGYPETLGGVIKNANYDIRSEPPNPRVPVSIFNNSTIVPDLMRPQFEIGR
jgi:hypothetical protein